ncbi:MAG: site-specific integrase [Chloroflexi bacterium]|nr:site-specific integrase [Chloroflexota bacterium]
MAKARGHIRQRSPGSWQVTIELPPDPGTGKRRQHVETVKGTQKEALKKLTELQRGVDQGLPTPRGKLTVGEWLTRWLQQDVKPQRRIRTYERYESIVRIHLIPAFGSVPLPQLAPSHIKQMLANMAKSGMATTSVAYHRTVLFGAMKAALRADLVARNPVEAAPGPRKDEKEVQPPDVRQVRAILARAESTGHWAFPILHALAYTGLRAGEAMGLLWQGVDLEGANLAVTQSLVRARAGKLIQPPKTKAGRRVVDIDGRTVQVLRALQGKQVLQRMEAQGAYSSAGYVFCNELGEPYDPKRVTRAFQNLAEQCGAGHLKLHSLRHFHATVLLQHKQSIVAVSKRLGHADVSTTLNVYAHILPGWGKDAAAAFAEAMGDVVKE